MTKAQLKSALISLALGILTMVITSLLEGLLKILKEWVATGAGGLVATSTYLIKHYRG